MLSVLSLWMQMYPPCVSEAVSEWLETWLTSLVLVCAAVFMGVFALPLIASLVPFNSFKDHLSYDYFSCPTLVLCFFLTAQNLWFHEPHHISVFMSVNTFFITLRYHGPWPILNSLSINMVNYHYLYLYLLLAHNVASTSCVQCSVV